MACVRCDQCNTWQHLLCYYDTEEEPEESETHLCDGCRDSSLTEVQEKSLLSSFNNLEIEPQDHDSTSLNLEENDPALGPFGFPGDENYFWGPEEPEIQRIMDTIFGNVRRVVYSMMSVGIDRRRTMSALLNGAKLGLRNLLENELGSSYLHKLQELVTQEERDTRALASMFTSLVVVLVCDKISTTTESKAYSIEALLLNALCHNVLQKSESTSKTAGVSMSSAKVSSTDGFEVLRDLTRTSLLSLTEEHNSSLGSLITADAERHAASLTSTLVAMIHPRSQRGKQEAPKWTKVFHHIFSIGFRLRTRLLLADRLYEFYFPKSGSNSSSSTMTNEARDKVPDDGVVDLCLMPAVIEYEPQNLGYTANMVFRLFSEGIFVTVTEEQRAKGNVASTAIVCLQS